MRVIKETFTTGEVAQISGLAPSTIEDCFDSGKLKGFRLPGSRYRWIPRKNLIKFFKEYGIPCEALENEEFLRVLVVSKDGWLINNLGREIESQKNEAEGNRKLPIKMNVAADSFDAGMQAESFHPDCIVVDFSIGQSAALTICQNLRRNEEFSEVVLISLIPSEAADHMFDRSSINETFKIPFDSGLFVERIRVLGASTVLRK